MAYRLTRAAEDQIDALLLESARLHGHPGLDLYHPPRPYNSLWACSIGFTAPTSGGTCRFSEKNITSEPWRVVRAL